jgi:hypothetical protein
VETLQVALVEAVFTRGCVCEQSSNALKRNNATTSCYKEIANSEAIQKM